MTFPEMVSRTAGDDCGKADGDYLAWESAEWVMKGKASFGEHSRKTVGTYETENCNFFPNFKRFWKGCAHLCQLKNQKG